MKAFLSNISYTTGPKIENDSTGAFPLANESFGFELLVLGGLRIEKVLGR